MAASEAGTGWPSAPQVSFTFAKGSAKVSRDLKITTNNHCWLLVYLFNTVKWCFYHSLNKIFNRAGSDGALITHSLKFRSLNVNSPHSPIPSMSLLQLGECLRYFNNIPFSYTYEKMHSHSTIMQLCLSSEMAKKGYWSHFEKSKGSQTDWARENMKSDSKHEKKAPLHSEHSAKPTKPTVWDEKPQHSRSQRNMQIWAFFQTRQEKRAWAAWCSSDSHWCKWEAAILRELSTDTLQ